MEQTKLSEKDTQSLDEYALKKHREMIQEGQCTIENVSMKLAEALHNMETLQKESEFLPGEISHIEESVSQAKVLLPN